MKDPERIVCGLLALILCCALSSSCSSFSMFGKSAEHAEEPILEDSEELPEIKSPQPAGKIESTGWEPAGKVDEEIEALEKKISRLEQRIRDLEQLNAQKQPTVLKLEYVDPVQLYQKARNLLLEGDAVTAARLFASFAEKHPDHSLADNALYWLGECHYSLGQYNVAAEEFKSLVKTYPKAEKVPDALLKIGYSYLSMDDINRASHYLKLVLKKYPFSLAAEKAQVKLKSLE